MELIIIMSIQLNQAQATNGKTDKLAQVKVALCDALALKAFAETRLRNYKDDLANYSITDSYTEEDYKEEMRYTQGSINILGIDFYQVDALCQLDYVAFRQSYLDYCDTIDLEDREDYQDLLNMIDYEEENIAALTGITKGYELMLKALTK